MPRTTTPPLIDHIDAVILKQLQHNAALRFEDIAKIVKLAPSSVHDRIRRLEKNGLIRRWTVEVDPLKLGLGVLAFIGVRATRPCSELIGSLSEMNGIEECHSVAGELSMILKVRVADTSALLEMCDALRQIPGVEGTDSTIVLKTHIDRPPSNYANS